MDLIMLIVLLLNMTAIFEEIYSLGIVLLTSTFFLAYMIIQKLQYKDKAVITSMGTVYIVGFAMMVLYSVCILFFHIDVKSLLNL